ncbi:MAG: BPSL0067 family protein [Xanthobacteraceae bacterium]
MKHVIWNESSNESVLGPGLAQGVNAVRGFLREYYAGLLAMAAWKGDATNLPANGPFDADLRFWVKQFQTAFNRSKGPLVSRKKSRLPHGNLIDTGEVDWGTRFVMGIDEKLARDDAIQLPSGVVAAPSSLTAIELKAAPRTERFGNAYRVGQLDLLLAKLGLQDRQEEMISKKRVAILDEGNFVVPEGHPLYSGGQMPAALKRMGLANATDKSECAALVQSLGVPNTNRWRRGPQVKDIEMLPRGTVIATLHRGVYLSDYSGESHVGVFLSKDDHGLWMLDQHIGENGNVGVRLKRFGAEHKKSPVSILKYIDPDFSYRMKAIDQSGQTIYAYDHSLETVRYRQNLTSDGSQYYVLVDDGTIARRDAPRDSAAHRLRTAEEQRRAKDDLREAVFPKALAEEIGKHMQETSKALREPTESLQAP